MTIDEAIKIYKDIANKDAICPRYCMSTCEECEREHKQVVQWLEELKYIENIILKWNADWYNEEDTGIPDNEILEAIFNACTGNGFDIPIDEDFSIGYDKAIDDFAKRLTKYLGVENATKYGNKDAEQQKNSYDTLMKYEIADAIDDVAEQLKAGGEYKSTEHINCSSDSSTNGWIPFSCGFPKNKQKVLVTLSNGDIRQIMFNEWLYEHPEYAHGNVPIAWMPLPEPYRPKGE